MTDTVMTIEHVTRRFGKGATEVVAVNDVSFEVHSGEIILIMGPSGSGKTTLLSMLGGLLKPSDGSIMLNGQNLANLTERDLPDVRLHSIGFIFQGFNLLSALNVLENVALVAKLAGHSREESHRRAQDILSQLELDHRLHFLPEKLSGGEKQRVAIARALVNKPELILADEPTANLDSHTGRETMRLLRNVARLEERGVIIVSHDQRIREIADRIMWLEDGTFKKWVDMETDPVCNMSIDKAAASAFYEYEGKTYYFCAEGCRDEFADNPERFISRKNIELQ